MNFNTLWLEQKSHYILGMFIMFLKSLVKNKFLEVLVSMLPSLSVLIFALVIHSAQSQAEFGSIVDVGLGGDFYFTDESANNGQGFINLLIQNTWSDSQLWLDIGAGGLVGETASSYFKAPQFYYRLGEPGKIQLTVGRAIYDWSFADDFWNLGMTQPIFKWNEARPEEQGLTGVFFSFPLINNFFEVTLYASFLFLPTQGPSFKVANGKVSSSNPWFNEPVEVINLVGEKADLNFEVDVPKTQDVVFQESYGFLLGTPQNKKDGLLNFFYLNKPRNEFILPFEGALNLSTFNGDITVLPRLARHQVMGGDIGWNARRFKTVFSWIYEADIQYDIPPGTTYPVYPDQNIFSITQLFRLSRTQRLWLGYVNVESGTTELGGVFANSQISTFLNRNRFKEAMRLKWEGLLFKRRGLYKINASLAYNQNLASDSVWISSNIKWALEKGIEVFSQCDFFGGADENIVGTDFISTYQNNDRCLVGGHYAF